MAYTTETLIEQELGEQFDANSTPNSTAITQWINEAQAEIDLITGTSFTTNTATDEYHDFPENGSVFMTKNRPVVSVTSMAFNENGLGYAANWVSLTEGYQNDYLLYKDTGRILIHSRSHTIPSGNQNIKITYVWGRSAVPATIQKLATLMVVERILDQKMKQVRKKNPLDMTLGEIQIRHSHASVVAQKKNYLEEVKELYAAHGKFKTYLDTFND